MKKEHVAPEVNFLDAKLISFTMDENNDLIVLLETFDDKKIKIIFLDVNYFAYKGGNRVANFYEVFDSPILNKKIAIRKQKGLSECVFKYLQIENLNNSALIEVICENVTHDILN